MWSMGQQHQEANRHRRRRGPRASQACDNCATAKTRCDNHECCQRCRRRNLTCIRPTPLHEKPSVLIATSEKTRPALQGSLAEDRHLKNSEDLCSDIVHNWIQTDIPTSRSMESSGHTFGKSPAQNLWLSCLKFNLP